MIIHKNLLQWLYTEFFLNLSETLVSSLYISNHTGLKDNSMQFVKSIKSYCAMLLCISFFMVACGSKPEPPNKEELRQRANEETSKL